MLEHKTRGNFNLCSQATITQVWLQNKPSLALGQSGRSLSSIVIGRWGVARCGPLSCFALSESYLWIPRTKGETGVSQECSQKSHQGLLQSPHSPHPL